MGCDAKSGGRREFAGTVRVRRLRPANPHATGDLGASASYRRPRRISLIQLSAARLEGHGLVEPVAERRKGNVTERILQAGAASYLVSPAALASAAPDPHYDGASKHTAFYLHTLGEYLKYFDGRQVVFTDVQAPPASAAPDGVARLKKALGVDGTEPGSAVELALDGVGRFSGEVDFANENFLGLRTADTLYRLFGRNAFRRHGRPAGPRLQRQRGFRIHGEGVGQVPREGLRVAPLHFVAPRESAGCPATQKTLSDTQNSWRHRTVGAPGILRLVE